MSIEAAGGTTEPGLSRRDIMKGAALALVAPAVLGQASAAEQKNLKLGTWKLNLERSVPAGGGGRTSEIRVYEDAGNGFVRSTRNTVMANGQKITAVYQAKGDNKEYPIVDGNGKQTGTFAFVTENGTDKFTTRQLSGGMITGETTPCADGKTLTMILRNGGNETRNIYDRVK